MKIQKIMSSAAKFSINNIILLRDRKGEAF